jgi:hypothetical protein
MVSQPTPSPLTLHSYQLSRGGIHESTTSLRFLGTILRFFRLILPQFLPFYKTIFMKGWFGFLSGFPPFDAFLIVVSLWGKEVFMYK